jgi:hypothetical protein
VRHIAAASMGRAGQWTAQQNEHVAEATLAASEDPIAGIDQNSEDYQLKMWKEFIGRDPQPDASTNYRKRSIAAVYKQSKFISKELQSFQAAVMFIDACNPTGNCTDDELFSLAIARHKDLMKGIGLDYAKKDTPHSEWVFHLAYKVLKGIPKWQGTDGPMMDLASGSPNLLSGVTTSRTDAQKDGDYEICTEPPGSKKAKRMSRDANEVSSAMLAVAKSMALSAESVSRNVAAQTERNGIMLFVGKVDQSDEDAKEHMKLKRMIHLKNARIEASDAEPATARERARPPSAPSSPASRPPPTGAGSRDMDVAANDDDSDVSAIEYRNILSPTYSITPRYKN